MSIFQALEGVGSGSETQIQMGGIKKKKSKMRLQF